MNDTDQHPELAPGLRLAEKYRLERELGRGAMGTVWAAEHETLGQRVAIKVISRQHAASEELRARFHTEARAAAKLRSRFVVGVYDHGETQSGLPFIVMEYLEGESLEDRIARQGVIGLADALRVTRHVSRALSRAHARGIIHRDLKPANIFITKSEDEEDGDDWTAKVLDFGIAKMEDFGERSTTKTGTVLGTPLFMSPEQVRGASAVDARADLYSLGMVVYNMLTGSHAFEGQSFGDLLVSICTDPLPPLTRYAPHVPGTVDSWFQKACARSPEERYPSADAMVQGLADALGDVTETGSRNSLTDVPSGSFSAQPPLAATFAVESTARHGTPSDSHGRPLLRGESPDGDVVSDQLDSSSASAVTVHEPSSSRSAGVLWLGGIGAVALLALVLTWANLHARSGGDAGETSAAASDSSGAPDSSGAAEEPPLAAQLSTGVPQDPSEEEPVESPKAGAGTADPPETQTTAGADPDTATVSPTEPGKGESAPTASSAPSPSARTASQASGTTSAPADAPRPPPTATLPPAPRTSPAPRSSPVTRPSTPDLGF